MNTRNNDEFLEALEFGQFGNLPKHSKRFARREKKNYLHLLVVSRPFTIICSTHQIKSRWKGTVSFIWGKYLMPITITTIITIITIIMIVIMMNTIIMITKNSWQRWRRAWPRRRRSLKRARNSWTLDTNRYQLMIFVLSMHYHECSHYCSILLSYDNFNDNNSGWPFKNHDNDENE